MAGKRQEDDPFSHGQGIGQAGGVHVPTPACRPPATSLASKPPAARHARPPRPGPPPPAGLPVRQRRQHRCSVVAAGCLAIVPRLCLQGSKRGQQGSNWSQAAIDRSYAWGRARLPPHRMQAGWRGALPTCGRRARASTLPECRPGSTRLLGARLESKLLHQYRHSTNPATTVPPTSSALMWKACCSTSWSCRLPRSRWKSLACGQVGQVVCVAGGVGVGVGWGWGPGRKVGARLRAARNEGGRKNCCQAGCSV